MLRKTISGRTFASLEKEAKIEIKTKAPSKWIFIDVEDCNIYTRDTVIGVWKGATDEQLDEAMKVLKREKKQRIEE